jgi:hypothetical protein
MHLQTLALVAAGLALMYALPGPGDAQQPAPPAREAASATPQGLPGDTIQGDRLPGAGATASGAEVVIRLRLAGASTLCEVSMRGPWDAGAAWPGGTLTGAAAGENAAAQGTFTLRSYAGAPVSVSATDLPLPGGANLRDAGVPSQGLSTAGSCHMGNDVWPFDLAVRVAKPVS